jgi:hypothetical protein
MRKIAGWICYLVGAGGGVVALQLIIQCELISVFNFSKVENRRFDFWEFILLTSGHHTAYPNGYLVHLMRDLFLLCCAVLVIKIGRDQFAFKESTRTEKIEMVTCPECHKQTYPDAYCRFCGFNLITHQPSRQSPASWPMWKVTLLAYGALSLFLLSLNLMMLR